MRKKNKRFATVFPLRLCVLVSFFFISCSSASIQTARFEQCIYQLTSTQKSNHTYNLNSLSIIMHMYIYVQINIYGLIFEDFSFWMCSLPYSLSLFLCHSLYKIRHNHSFVKMLKKNFKTPFRSRKINPFNTEV